MGKGRKKSSPAVSAADAAGLSMGKGRKGIPHLLQVQWALDYLFLGICYQLGDKKRNDPHLLQAQQAGTYLYVVDI